MMYGAPAAYLLGLLLLFASCVFNVLGQNEAAPTADSCVYDGRIIDNREKFTLNSDPCVRCMCKNGQLKCRTKTCLPVKCEKPVLRLGKCCPICIHPDDIQQEISSVSDNGDYDTDVVVFNHITLPPPPIIPPPPPSLSIPGTAISCPANKTAINDICQDLTPPPRCQNTTNDKEDDTRNNTCTCNETCTCNDTCTTCPPGPPGLQGPSGEQGPKGDIGDEGRRGKKGDRGDPGPQGEQGSKGDQGERGLPGPPGPSGATTAGKGVITIPGPQGPKGHIGLPGPRGPIGPPGPPGADGRRGKRGRPGPIGPTGETGLKGLRGERGPPGPRGPAGRDGINGGRGIAGPVGPKGDKGDPGKRGYPGQQGVKGEPGQPFLTIEGQILIVPNEFAMNTIRNEAALVYRSDDKKLYFRDNEEWNCLMTEGGGMHGGGRPGPPGPPGATGPKGEKGETANLKGIPVGNSCGNAKIEPGEDCDDGNSFTTDSCIDCRRSYCGDGYRQEGVEECDGKDFADLTCDTYFSAFETMGSLRCTNRCQIDTGNCKVVRRRRRAP